MHTESIKATGNVTLVMKDEQGNVVYEHSRPNVVVTVGKTALAAWLAAGSQTTPFMPYIGLGTGSTPATTADTNLETPLATRVLGTSSSASNVLTVQSTFGAGVNTGTITEAGLFSASSGGTMFARQVFSAVSKLAGNSLTATWQITFS